MEDALYRKKVLGCWLGKAVGGTLGAPVEGHPGPLKLDFYDPVPTTMVPNDDLDLQVVWACALAKLPKPVVNRHVFEKCWLENVGFPWDEYAVAIRNLKNGIHAPFSGSYDNWFVDGMGCAIRSEIWACLAPGNPEFAARLAYEDACVDHAGDGMWAEMFLAAMESAAFYENDVRKIIEVGKAQIPADCLLRIGIEDAIAWYDEKADFDWLFEKIMAKYKSDNFTDVKVNFPIMVAGLLLGQGDFSKSICYAVNFGEDTDCTGATVGALLGIMNPDGIPDKWLKPIGRDMVLSPGITGVTPPPTIDAFSDMICEMSKVIELDPQPAESFAPKRVHAKYCIRKYREQTRPETPVIFEGTFAEFPEVLPERNELVMEFKFKVPVKGAYFVMFNSKSQMSVDVDGKFAFRRVAGTMAPSFHRAPWNSEAKLELEAGEHTLLATVWPEPGKKPNWVVGVAYGDNLQWVPDAML